MTQHYTVTKIVEAWPQVQVQDNEARDGYAVKYADGYTSWSPKDTFEAAYLPLGHISHLPAHVQRMYAEAAELGSRLKKLDAFAKTDAFFALGEHERYLLRSQASAMTAYGNTLSMRIELANPTPTAQADTPS